MGGAGLVFAEMTCVSPEGRITPGCPGLWNDAQRDAWARIANWIHVNTDAKFAIQLGHAGAKGSTKLAWDGMDLPLDGDDNWELLSASPQQYLRDVSQLSHGMTRADMDTVTADFVRSTTYAAEAGVDWLELHCAHGYLLSSFISPLTNHRTDEYGGTLENRLRYPLEVFAAVRAAWPAHLPISVRISAHDWVPGGITPDDAVAIGKAFKAAGADMIDCSSGQVSPDAKPVYGRMYQTPFADRVRNEGGIATIAVGAITEADHVNSIIAAGRADLCAIARPHLANPAWTLTEAARIGWNGRALAEAVRSAASRRWRHSSPARRPPPRRWCRGSPHDDAAGVTAHPRHRRRSGHRRSHRARPRGARCAHSRCSAERLEPLERLAAELGPHHGIVGRCVGRGRRRAGVPAGAA